MSDNNKEDEVLKRLENANKDEAKNIILETIIPECRGIAGNFFDCLENKMKTVDFNNPQEYEKLEKILNEKFVPDCMSSYNLEECISKNEKN